MPEPNDDLDFDFVGMEPTKSVDPELADPATNPDPNEPKKPITDDPSADPAGKLEDGKGDGKGGKPPKSDPDPANPDPDPNKGPENPDPDGEEDSDLFVSMAERLGLTLPEGVEFEDSEEGLQQFTELAADQLADAKLNSYLESLPPIAGDFFDYLTMLGEEATEDKIKAFFVATNPEIDYTKVDLEDVAVQKAVMKTFYKNAGWSDEDVQDTLNDLEISNTLKKQADKASKLLAKQQSEARQELLAKEKEANLAKKQSTQRFFSQVKTVIDSGKINNFTVPVNERGALLEYDTKGQFMADLNQILKDPASRAELALAVKHKFKLDKFVSAAATTQRANSLFAKVKGSKSTPKGAADPRGANNEIDWDAPPQA